MLQNIRSETCGYLCLLLSNTVKLNILPSLRHFPLTCIVSAKTKIVKLLLNRKKKNTTMTSEKGLTISFPNTDIHTFPVLSKQ